VPISDERSCKESVTAFDSEQFIVISQLCFFLLSNYFPVYMANFTEKVLTVELTTQSISSW
jgi:hypothetical protein